MQASVSKASSLPTVMMVGLGYIGLPTAAVVARSGCTVLGLDVKQSVVDTINRGEVHIEEHDLDTLVKDMVQCGRLSASLTPEPCDIFLIAVPTPFKGNHVPDISFILQAVTRIAPVLKKGDLIILESTSPIGTTEQIAKALYNERPDLAIAGYSSGKPDIHLAYCPERVLPGRILTELVENDRSIGGITAECTQRAKEFYEIFVQGECIETTARTAEMVKLVENASRDVSIAFANELSLIADRVDLDVWEVIRLANHHPRVNILQPGPGVGGHCIAVDPWFLVNIDREITPLITTARKVNDNKPAYVVEQVSILAEAHPDAKIACFGLAFKANVDDFRESPALEIAIELSQKYGSRLTVVEPFADILPDQLNGTGAELVEMGQAIEQCDILVLLVDHKPFKAVSFEKIASKLVYDSRGIWPK